MIDKFEDRQAITLTSQGLKLFAVFHLPLMKKAEKVPAVLFCHGFGGNKSGRYRLYVRLAERLAQVGIAALRFDFRGCGDSEGAFRDITIESQLQDAMIAAQFLLTHPQLDPDRFGLFGSSLGGSLATLLSTKLPQTKAIALLASPFDAKPWLDIKTSKQTTGNLQFDHEQQRICFLGEPLSAECIAQFASLDLTSALRQIPHLPLLLIRGQNDATVDKYHLEQYEKERKESEGQTKVLTLALSGHDFGEPKEQELLFNETVGWFEKYLEIT
jgi:fermentation-respiration switch protein FrsA (DUF1100 family)